MRQRILCCTIGLVGMLLGAQAGAADGGTLRDVARKAVTGNPEVLSAYHEYEAAVQETRGARGGYYPRLDMVAGVGRQRTDDPRFPANDFSRDRVTLSLSQMLFDGFATRNEVKRLDYAARTRYHELLSFSEDIAAETARAYYDVLRHRELVALSEQNYATHRMIYDQIEQRVRAGISRRVDLEQASGRLALSESNLLTDVTNLHDVSMRYQRIVGSTPGEDLAEPEIAPNLFPPTLKETLQLAYTNNPLMSAAISNVWSAERATDVAKAAFVPRFDVVARQDIWHDRDDIHGRYEDGVIELVMTYNLFNGGSDVAAKRRVVQKKNQAVDLREKTCRDIRQEVSIAYNNTRRLEEQMGYLDRHQLAIEKAREAYRRQFDIGQRTLLDMLDTENEYYEARRAYLNAQRDHAISYTRTLAGLGGLVAALELGNDLHAVPALPAPDQEIPDMYAVCPAETVVVPPIDKEQLFRDALDRAGALARPGRGPVAPADSPAPAADAAAPGSTEGWVPN